MPRLGVGQGIGKVIVQCAPTGSHPPNGTLCPGGGMGLGMRWWTRLKADENVSGGEGDHEDEGGGPPHPIHG